MYLGKLLGKSNREVESNPSVVRLEQNPQRIETERKKILLWVQSMGGKYRNWWPFITVYNTGLNLFISFDNSPTRIFRRSMQWYWLPYAQWNSHQNPLNSLRTFKKFTEVTLDHQGHVMGNAMIAISEKFYFYEYHHRVGLEPGAMLHIVDSQIEGIFFHTQWHPLPMMHPAITATPQVAPYLV